MSAPSSTDSVSSSADVNSTEQQHHDSSSSSSSSSGAGGAGATTDDRIEARFLIENSLVGGIIGSAGNNVKNVREESGAYVTIARTNTATVDRIMKVHGQVEQVAKAIAMLAELVIGARMHNLKRSAEESAERVPATRPEKVALRLLVHFSSAGAFIGKGAVLLKETQEISGVRISVGPETLPNSTEKIVTVTGTPAALQIAFARILDQLKSSPHPRQRIVFYDPSNAVVAGLQQQYYTQAQMYAPMPQYQGAAAAAAQGPTSSQKIAVPSVCAGCIIGRGGSVIRDLRMRSGADISIQDPDPKTPSERVVTLTGTPLAIQNAVYMIRQLVEQYQPRQAGGGAAGGEKY